MGKGRGLMGRKKGLLGGGGKEGFNGSWGVV